MSNTIYHKTHYLMEFNIRKPEFGLDSLKKIYNYGVGIGHVESYPQWFSNTKEESWIVGLVFPLPQFEDMNKELRKFDHFLSEDKVDETLEGNVTSYGPGCVDQLELKDCLAIPENFGSG